MTNKQVSNKQVAAIVWESFGVPVFYICCGAITIYFFVMGPTSLGWFLLGKFTYSVAHFLFYWGSALLAALLGFAISVKLIFANWPDA